MDRQERRVKIATELFATAVRDEQLLRIDRGPAGRGEEVEFKEKSVEAIADACVRAADQLIQALDRVPTASSHGSGKRATERTRSRG